MNATDPLLWSYVALAALALAALMVSAWPWPVRVLLVAAVGALYVLAHDVLEDVWGRPGRGPLPERFVLLAAVIEEPGKATPGALFLWVQPLRDGRPERDPRAYRLPYAKDLHGVLDEALKKTRQGVSQLGSAEPKPGPRGFSWWQPAADALQLKIRDLPVPQLPEK